ncbi:MAG: hypothetical protein ACPGN6_07010 [Gammaproteobacteria bacterium]
MDLIPFVGLGDVVFGQCRNTISQNIGAPEKKATMNNLEKWSYRLLRIELSFSHATDFRLTEIVSNHPYTLVLGFNPIGLKETFLLQKFPNLQCTDNNSLEEPSLGLVFTLSSGAVSHVIMRPQKHEQTGEYIWPKTCGLS